METGERVGGVGWITAGQEGVAGCGSERGENRQA